MYFDPTWSSLYWWFCHNAVLVVFCWQIFVWLQQISCSLGPFAVFCKVETCWIKQVSAASQRFVGGFPKCSREGLLCSKSVSCFQLCHLEQWSVIMGLRGQGWVKAFGPTLITCITSQVCIHQAAMKCPADGNHMPIMCRHLPIRCHQVPGYLFDLKLKLSFWQRWPFNCVTPLEFVEWHSGGSGTGMQMRLWGWIDYSGKTGW